MNQSIIKQNEFHPERKAAEARQAQHELVDSSINVNQITPLPTKEYYL